MCELAIREEIARVREMYFRTNKTFCAADVVEEVRKAMPNRPIHHTEVAVELFKAFQEGRFPRGYLAQDVYVVSDRIHYIVYRYSRHASDLEPKLIKQTYRGGQ